MSPLDGPDVLYLGDWPFYLPDRPNLARPAIPQAAAGSGRT